jgi:DNA polymerase
LPNRVEGYGSLEPELMIIGEAPGKNEDEMGRPFVGATGQMLNEYLFKAGINRNDCYLTNVVKYRPPMNDFKKLHLIGVDIDECIKELWEFEIKKLRPKCILAIGNEALKAVCDLDGILNYRGSILRARDGVTKCVPTVHPAALFSRSEGDESKGGLDWTWTKLIEADVIRAGEESKSREFNLPSRHLAVAHSSLDVHRFFEEYKKLDCAAMDIESINCIPVCIGWAYNRHHAISIPCYVLSVSTRLLTWVISN